ncbi:hypothetical protein MN116_005436 [Schistosoma mekongi]|uniref:Trichohyalin-plectin-homology domain-containing protein n=1 Tax=Schistosoma mekongi TaxID=38744 RepID=A0AAE1ZE77_SCHME|nr:hypothetical protein MN116_005436 [Schistosoma mekongi]
MKNRKEFSFENPNNNVSMDIRRVKLISQSEWERLRKQLDNNLSETTKAEEKKLETEKIKAQSKEMIKSWTNTLLGGRQKKLEERANRLAEEEKAKLAIDYEEAKYQAEQRKKAIDKAKLQLYYETDRVRLLHSGLTLTETLKERDMQLEFKQLKNKLEEKKEKIYVEKMRKTIESAIKKEQVEAERRHAKNMLIAQELTAQIKEHDEQKKREKEQILAEGEELRKIATIDLLEREKLEQIYREQMNKLAKEFRDQINGNKQMRDIERLRDEEIEEQCRLFAAAKIKMTKMRILKEREIFKDKEEQLQKIQEYLSEQLKNAQNTEELRLNKAINEREEKYQHDTKEKQEKQMRIMHEINEYRMNELERRRKLLEEKKEIELNEIRERISNELALVEYENACKAKRFEERKQLSQQLLQESIKKRENINEERKKEIEMVENQNKLYQLEENIFQDYAKRIINHCKANDRNVYPLEKAVHIKSIIGLGTGLPGKPSLVTINHNNSLIDNQYNNDHSINNHDQYINKELNNNNKNNTNERLGFVW